MKCNKCNGTGVYLTAGFTSEGMPTKKEVECDRCEGTGVKGGYSGLMVAKLEELLTLLRPVKNTSKLGGKNA